MAAGAEAHPLSRVRWVGDARDVSAKQRIDVDQRFLGGADLEEVELRLLARLVEMGYRATRAPGQGGA